MLYDKHAGHSRVAYEPSVTQSTVYASLSKYALAVFTCMGIVS